MAPPAHPSLHPGSWRRRLAWLDHLAVWMGLYAGGGTLVATVLLDRPIRPAAVGFVITLTMSVYLMDRVKPIDRLVDPADAAAHPVRHGFMVRHAGLMRLAVIGLALLAAACAWRHDRRLVGLIPAAHAGVLFYASAPRAVRPKRRLLLKNATVAVSLAALCLVAALLPDGGAAAGPVAIVGAFLVLQVAGDAMMCDLDDAEADRRFGTATVANRFGRNAAWRVAIVLQAIGAVSLLAGAVPGWVDRTAAIAVCSALAAGGAVLLAVRPATVRDLVDARFPLAVAIAWAITAMIP